MNAADKIDEASIRRAAEEKVARKYKLERDKIEVEYKTDKDYYEGKGFATKPTIERVWVDHETGIDYVQSAEELNRPENRWNRLYQENLSKIGESDEQKEIKELPIFGIVTKPYMDQKYGRISRTEAIVDVARNVAKEVATTAAGGAILKGTGKLAEPVLKIGVSKFSELLLKSKSAAEARFTRNLFEILNKGLKNPNSGFVRFRKPSAAETRAASSARTGAAPQFSGLDWSSYRISHVREHMNPNISKLEHGVFYGNPIEVTNEAWAIAQEQNIRPILIGGRDHYIIPRANSGFASGAIGNRENLNHVLLITEHGTNQIVTSLPSSATTANIRAFINSAIYGEK